MPKTHTLRAAFSSCSRTMYTLTDAVRLHTAQHDGVRVAVYAGFSHEHLAPLFVVQTRLGDGADAVYAYQHQSSLTYLNTPVFKAMKLRGAWQKRSAVQHEFCGIRIATLALGDDSEVRLYVRKDDPRVLVSALRTYSGRDAEYSYEVAAMPSEALAPLSRMTTFFSR